MVQHLQSSLFSDQLHHTEATRLVFNPYLLITASLQVEACPCPVTTRTDHLVTVTYALQIILLKFIKLTVVKPTINQ